MTKEFAENTINEMIEDWGKQEGVDNPWEYFPGLELTKISNEEWRIDDMTDYWLVEDSLEDLCSVMDDLLDATTI